MKTMIQKKLSGFFLALLIAPALFASNYEVDASSSTVNWLGKKVTGEHHGTINVKEGSLDVVDNTVKGGTIIIDMQSITNKDLTDEDYNKKLVGHLKSDDFFSVEKHPTAKLVLTSVNKEGDQYTFNGDLTIKGITNPISFKGKSSTQSGAVKVEGSMTVDRSKYNVRYGSSSFFANLGDKVIYDDFTLDFVLVAEK